MGPITSRRSSSTRTTMTTLIEHNDADPTPRRRDVKPTTTRRTTITPPTTSRATTTMTTTTRNKTVGWKSNSSAPSAAVRSTFLGSQRLPFASQIDFPSNPGLSNLALMVRGTAMAPRSIGRRPKNRPERDVAGYHNAGWNAAGERPPPFLRGGFCVVDAPLQGQGRCGFNYPKCPRPWQSGTYHRTLVKDLVFSRV